MRVGLIVTGECERVALASSLQRFFRQGLGVDIAFEVVDQVDSFTSASITDPPQVGVRTTADKFAAALVAAVESRKHDLIVAVDDLEIVNLHQAPRTVGVLHAALRRHLALQVQTHIQLARFRTAASFHLLAPMVEACFFPEPEALNRAGKALGRESRFRWPAIDFEAFEVDDPDFLAPPDNRNPDLRTKTWAIADRGRHPKAYLRFLCQPDDPSCRDRQRRYQESRQGAAALRLLDWSLLLAQPAYGRFVRSMIADIADAAGVELNVQGEVHPDTRTGNGRLLRNL